MHYKIKAVENYLGQSSKITEEFIEQKICVKYLVIQIDSQLKWKEHVASVSLKVSRAIGMIKYTKSSSP